MKKRLISMLMAVLMIASLLPAAALAGDDTSDTHEHKYTTVSIKKDAEKKTPGVEYKVCKECGKIIDLFDEPAPRVTETKVIDGNIVQEEQLYYKGICSACAQKMEKKTN